MIWLLYLIDQLGRRPLLIAGSVGGAISMYYIGAYIAIVKPSLRPTSSLTTSGKSAGECTSTKESECLMIVVAFFYIWTIFYSPTWNGTPWVISAEFFPQHVRTFTQACMAASNWFWGYAHSIFLIGTDRFQLYHHSLHPTDVYDHELWGIHLLC